MEWLKDKKNLPFVIAIAVFAILLAGGVGAYESGVFQGSPPPIAATPTTATPGGPGVSSDPREAALPPGVRPQGLPIGTTGSSGRGFEAQGEAAPAAAVVAKTPAVINPAVGPDPFSIPGGQKKIMIAQASLKLPIRDIVSPLNLFQIHPPTPPVPPSIPGSDQGNGQDPTANYRLAGIVTGSDGINAILEVGGSSQTVKPGDSLPDGSSVQNIQTTSVTLRTSGGTIVTLPLSAGNPDQGTNNPYGQQQFNPGFNPGFNGRFPFNNGQAPYNGQPQYNGQPPFDQQGK